MSDEEKSFVIVDKKQVWVAYGAPEYLKKIQAEIKEDPDLKRKYMHLIKRGKPCYCGSKKKFRDCCARKFGIADQPIKNKKLTKTERNRLKRQRKKKL